MVLITATDTTTTNIIVITITATTDDNNNAIYYYYYYEGETGLDQRYNIYGPTKLIYWLLFCTLSSVQKKNVVLLISKYPVLLLH